jgi:hypothetical protein
VCKNKGADILSILPVTYWHMLKLEKQMKKCPNEALEEN